MREAHPLSKRVIETLEIGEDEDLFGRQDHPAPAPKPSASREQRSEEPSFGDALIGLLGCTTAGSAG